MHGATSESPSGAVAEVKDKGAEIISSTQDQVSAKAHELGGDAVAQIREQLDQRSTRAGEQAQAIGHALQSGVTQLRSEGNEMPAKVLAEVARRADHLGAYLESANADQILGELEGFARRRPWLTAGVGVLAGLMASRFVKASGDRRYEVARTNGNGSSSRVQPSLPAGRA